MATHAPKVLVNGNSYEADREARIAANQAKMKAVGLFGAAQDLAATVKPAKKQVVQRKPTLAQAQIVGPIRKSTRFEGKPPPSYKEDVKLYAESESRASSKPKSKKRSREVRDGRPPEHHCVAVANKEAQIAAQATAKALCAQVEGLAGTKEMLHSHVNTGYWLQGPPEFIGTLPRFKCDMKLVSTEAPRDDIIGHRYLPQACDTHYRLKDENQDLVEPPSWHFVWLPRTSGAGFSGGWRGFAIDMLLRPGDAVVFEVENASADKGVVKAHIIRAQDYDPNYKATAEEYVKKLAEKPSGGTAATAAADGAPGPVEDESEDAAGTKTEATAAAERPAKKGRAAAVKPAGKGRAAAVKPAGKGSSAPAAAPSAAARTAGRLVGAAKQRRKGRTSAAAKAASPAAITETNPENAAVAPGSLAASDGEGDDPEASGPPSPGPELASPLGSPPSPTVPSSPAMDMETAIPEEDAPAIAAEGSESEAPAGESESEAAEEEAAVEGAAVAAPEGAAAESAAEARPGRIRMTAQHPGVLAAEAAKRGGRKGSGGSGRARAPATAAAAAARATKKPSAAGAKGAASRKPKAAGAAGVETAEVAEAPAAEENTEEAAAPAAANELDAPAAEEAGGSEESAPELEMAGAEEAAAEEGLESEGSDEIKDANVTAGAAAAAPPADARAVAGLQFCTSGPGAGKRLKMTMPNPTLRGKAAQKAKPAARVRKPTAKAQQAAASTAEASKAPKAKKAASSQPPAAPPCTSWEPDAQFDVEKILSTAVDFPTGVRLFKVRWVGYGPEHDTWEPADNLEHAPHTYKWAGRKPKEVMEW